MGPTTTEKVDLITTQSDLMVLQEKGFVLEKMVGEGSYAKVYKAMHIFDETRHAVLACKVIDTAVAPRDYLTKFLPRELDVLIRVNHPHIINVSNIFQRRAKYFIFLRYAENGDLLDFITQNGAVPENQCRLWMRQILSAIYYIHTMNIAHRDLKCENILITSNYNVKLTDFGFSRNVYSRGQNILSETYCGSLSYAAPEVLKGVPYLPKLADMWSVGIILYTMLNKALPFNETSVKRLYEKQVMRKWRFRTNIVNQLSTECKQQVTALIEPDPAARPAAGSLFTAPWIMMDPRLSKMTFLEESLIRQAYDEAYKRDKEYEQESEVERIAELRRKGRGKAHENIFKVKMFSCPITRWDADASFCEAVMLVKEEAGRIRQRRRRTRPRRRRDSDPDFRHRRRGLADEGLKILKNTSVFPEQSQQLFES